jgi:glutathione S-transferase
MSLHLISFKTCPFVQRAVITLKHKNIDFDITYIDLAEPPDWFLEMSPLGKVPVLKVDDEILFESAVINEYLDEITGGELQPKEPLARAKNRAWIEFASNMLGNLYMMKMSKDEEHFEKYRELLVSQLHRVEKRLGDGPWFNGAEFSLADTAFAPLFRQNSVAGGKLSVLDADTMWPCRRYAIRWSTNSRICIYRRCKRMVLTASLDWRPSRNRYRVVYL